MKILVTGADGQLGRKLREAAAKSSDNYIFTDVGELDITDAGAVLSAGADVDAVVNCAAYTAVDAAEDNSGKAAMLNSDAARNLAGACLKAGATLIHISTDYVFDGLGNVPYTEEDDTSPRSVYGSTKLAGEQAVTASGCRYVIIRTSWLYSEHGNNFVKTMLRLTGEKESVKVVFDQTGSPTYAGDLAAAIAAIIEKRLYEGHEGIYHYSNEGVCSWYDLAVQTAQLAGNKGKVIPCRSGKFPAKAHRPAYSVLDKGKFRENFGLEIPYWRDSLIKCIDNLKKTE